MENFLKQEIAIRIPAARFSFSQRGFVVFKLDRGDDDTENGLVSLTTARTFGDSLFDIRFPVNGKEPEQGRWSPKAFETSVAQHQLLDANQADLFVDRLIESLGEHPTTYDGFHFFLRDGLNPAGNFNRSGQSKSTLESEEKTTPDIQNRLQEFSQRVATHLRQKGYLNSEANVNDNASTGQTILDVCLLNPFHFWVGRHEVQQPQHRWPGGVLPVVPGEAAPISRAYFKLREAILWSGIPYSQQLNVAEIGASPGGSCQWMLEQGMKVVGIDPADIDPLVAENPHFTHVRRRALEVKRKDISNIDWLVSDAILSPAQILGTYEELLKHPTVQPKHLIITLKLPDLKLLKDLDQWIERVKKWGYRNIHCRQLIFNRQEICMVASR